MDEVKQRREKRRRRKRETGGVAVGLHFHIRWGERKEYMGSEEEGGEGFRGEGGCEGRGHSLAE